MMRSGQGVWRLRLQIALCSLVNLALIAVWIVARHGVKHPLLSLTNAFPSRDRAEWIAVSDQRTELRDSNEMQDLVAHFINSTTGPVAPLSTSRIHNPNLPETKCPTNADWNEHEFHWLPNPDREFDANTMPIANLTETSDVSITRLPMFDNVEGEAFYAEMSNSLLLGPFLKLYNCHVVYFPGGCNKNPEPFPLNIVRQASVSDLQVVDHVVVISQFWGSAYYHWLIESLPRMAMMYEYLMANPDAKILMYNLPDITWELLTLLDLEPNRRMIPFNPDQLYFIQHAVAPSPAPCGHALSIAIRHLKQLILSKAAEKFRHEYAVKIQQKTPYMIVVQRRDFYAKRSIMNHDELVRAVSIANPDANVIEFGPDETFWPMFKKHVFADIIIGPHGAGLSNVLFAPDTVTLLELHPDQGNQEDGGPHHINLCHQRTANRTGVRSVLLLEDNGDADSPFYVNSDRVVEVIAKIRSGLWDQIPVFV